MKYDIPSTLKSEASQYSTLAFKTPLGTTSGTFTSVSSGTVYTYTNDSDLTTQLFTVLQPYIISATDFNNKIDSSTLLTNIKSVDGKGSGVDADLIRGTNGDLRFDSIQSTTQAPYYDTLGNVIRLKHINNPASFVSLANLVSNGSFANGTTGWTATNATGFTASGNVASFTATVQNGSITQTKNFINSHKYYVCASFLSSGSGQLQFQLNDGGSGWFSTFFNIPTSWSFVSIYFTSTNTGNGILFAEDPRSSGWTQIQVKNVILIDLTAAYGAGNEPTQAQMDSIMSDFNGFFNGSVSVPAIANTVTRTDVFSYVSLTNLVTNGNFENGLTGWTFVGTAPTVDAGITKFGSQSLKSVVSSSYTAWLQDFAGANGHVIYICGWFYLSSYTAGGAKVAFYDYNTYSNAQQGIINSTKLNQWQFVSALKTSAGGGYRAEFDIAIGGSTLTANCDGIMIIDLTSAYGVGNEPTQAQMDAIVQNYGFIDISPVQRITETRTMITGETMNMVYCLDSNGNLVNTVVS